MAVRSKTPSAPVKRGKNTPVPDAPAATPAKTKAPRAAPVDSAVQEQTFESPPGFVEQQPAAASAGREDRASRALDAIKTLSDMIAEGIGTLADLRAEMRQMSGRLDQLVASRPNAAQAAAADDYQPGREHDPGDAVPPGVAVMSPTPLTETDETALHSLEELPKRAGPGKRGPRAKS